MGATGAPNDKIQSHCLEKWSQNATSVNGSVNGRVNGSVNGSLEP